MQNIVIIGAGGVAGVTAHKCAQYNDVLGDICIASRTQDKCDSIIDSIHAKKNKKIPDKKLFSVRLDATEVESTVRLIKESEASLVINAGSPWINLPVMEACLQAIAAYIDTSVCVDLCSEGQQAPNAYDLQWEFREKFRNANLTGILGAGFDPGMVSSYAAYARNHIFDRIISIDVMDVNAGDHGKKWATNFDPETNMLEIQGDSFYWEQGGWKRVPCHTRWKEFDFPVVGEFRVYSMAHDEIRSLAEFIEADRIEFWMGFSDNYLKYFNVLRDIGMLSPDPVRTDNGIEVSPLKVLKAVLPDPVTLALGSKGKTCIGDLIKGKKDGQEKEVFIYNICDHEKCFAEVGSQAISYTAGVPPVAAAMLVMNSTWDTKRLVNMEELDPDPFLNLVGKIGLPTEILEIRQ